MISYPSEDLTIHGFIAIPRGMGPFPVGHRPAGWVNPAIYEALDYTTAYANHLARDGFLVFHPKYARLRALRIVGEPVCVGMPSTSEPQLPWSKRKAGQEGPLAIAGPQ
jgi:hypothetical protein